MKSQRQGERRATGGDEAEGDAERRQRRGNNSQLRIANTGTRAALKAAGHQPDASPSRARMTKPSKVKRIWANRLRQKSTATEAAPRAGSATRCCNSRARTTSPPICAAG